MTHCWTDRETGSEFVLLPFNDIPIPSTPLKRGPKQCCPFSLDLLTKICRGLNGDPSDRSGKVAPGLKFGSSPRATMTGQMMLCSSLLSFSAVSSLGGS